MNAKKNKPDEFISEQDLGAISDYIAKRKKDAVLNIRINSEDLKRIKQKAKKMGVKYQTFISEILHRIAWQDI